MNLPVEVWSKIVGEFVIELPFGTAADLASEVARIGSVCRTCAASTRAESVWKRATIRCSPAPLQTARSEVVVGSALAKRCEALDGLATASFSWRRLFRHRSQVARGVEYRVVPGREYEWCWAGDTRIPMHQVTRRSAVPQRPPVSWRHEDLSYCFELYVDAPFTELEMEGSTLRDPVLRSWIPPDTAGCWASPPHFLDRERLGVQERLVWHATRRGLADDPSVVVKPPEGLQNTVPVSMHGASETPARWAEFRLVVTVTRDFDGKSAVIVDVRGGEPGTPRMFNGADGFMEIGDGDTGFISVQVVDGDKRPPRYEYDDYFDYDEEEPPSYIDDPRDYIITDRDTLDAHLVFQTSRTGRYDEAKRRNPTLTADILEPFFGSTCHSPESPEELCSITLRWLDPRCLSSGGANTEADEFCQEHKPPQFMDWVTSKLATIQWH